MKLNNKRNIYYIKAEIKKATIKVDNISKDRRAVNEDSSISKVRVDQCTELEAQSRERRSTLFQCRSNPCL